MSGIAPGPDPSMEDILASIRRILDEDPAAAANAEAAAPPTALERPVPASDLPPAAAEAQDDELLLDETMLVEQPRRPSAAPPWQEPEPMSPVPEAPEPAAIAPPILLSPALDLPAAAPPYVPPPFPPPPFPPPEAIMPATPSGPLFNPELDEVPGSARPTGGLLDAVAADVTASSMMNLVRAVAAERTTAISRGGPTIEDVVREEIRPLLKDWLDSHLPPLVERLVRAEIERVVARTAF